MNWFNQIMSSDIVYRIGWAIIHSTWQGLATAAAFGLALLCIPKRQSNLRYGCGCLALLIMLAAFCGTAWIAGPRPDEPAAVNPWRAQPTAPSLPPANREAAPAVVPANDSVPAVTPEPTPETPPPAPPAKPWTQRFARAVSPWTEYVCAAWLVGVFAMSVWNLGGWIAVRRLRMIGTWPAPETLLGVVRDLSQRFSIRRGVTLLQSTVVKVPMTIGWLKPVVLIPAGILAELSPQHIETIIAHELAHVRRCDYLVNLLQTVVETLFFHHPAVWWISHRVRLEREYCCDNAVVRLTADQVNYAKALTEIAERRDRLPQTAVAADGGSLVGRIRRILGLERESSLLRNRSAGWAVVALVFVITAFAIGIGVSSDALWAAPYKYGADTDDGTYATFQKMIGTWRVSAEKSTGAGSVKRIELKPDATCIRHESAEDDPNPRTFYDHILLKDNGLIVSGYWGKQTFAMAFEDNTMTWTEGDTRFVFERRTATPSAAEAPTSAAAFLGTWEMVEGTGPVAAQMFSTWTFEVDGVFIGSDSTGKHKTERGTWEFKDGRIIVGGIEEIGVQIESGQLIVTAPRTNTSAVFKRKPGDAEITTEALRQVGAKLEFHVLPEKGGDRPDLTEEAIKKYRTQLEEEGPLAGKARGDSYQWAGVDAGFTAADNVVQGQYKGQGYVLFSATAGESLCADGRWGLTEVSSAQDDMGRPCIDFRLDTKGSELFYALTRDNVRKQLAMLIDGTVYSAPRIMTPVGGRAMIVGQFSKEEVEKLVAALRAGMPPGNYDAGAAPAAPQQPWVGTWRAQKAWHQGIEKDAAVNLELNADGTFKVTVTGEDDLSDAGRYSVNAKTVLFEGTGALDAAVAGVFEDDTLILSGGGDRVVLKRYEPLLAALAGTWSGPNNETVTISESGEITTKTPDGETHRNRITIRDGKPVMIADKEEHLFAVSGDVLSTTRIDVNANFPEQHVLRRVGPDKRFIGAWKSAQFAGAIDKQITALSLTLKDDRTWVLVAEGADAGEPVRGFYETDGDILTMKGRTPGDQDAMQFIKSARYDYGTIRLAIGAGAAILQKSAVNPFAGPEHPMFRAELTSHEGPNGQTWLDLDTGRIINAEEFSASEHKSDYELTIGVGQLIRQWPAKMLPIHNVGIEFARAGAAAIKYLPSLEQSRLTRCDYKGGAFVAVLTDRGNLALVEMMTPTGEDLTPVAWSLASITSAGDGAPQVRIIDLATAKKASVEPRRILIPDADTKDTPVVLDLASGEMLAVPGSDDGTIINHFTLMGKGDLFFDQVLGVLRGGSVQHWTGHAWAALAPDDRRGDATAYQLPAVPCRLLVTTGSGGKFEVTVLAKTSQGGIEIEYLPSAGTQASQQTREYVVGPGDTLLSISQRLGGIQQATLPLFCR